MKFENISLCVVLLALAALTGCAASGTPFHRVGEIPLDKGVIYVYRPGSLIGSKVRYEVHAGNGVVCTLLQGGYCTYFATPGSLEMWGKTESKGSSIIIDVKATQEYYVKVSPSIDFIVKRPNLSLMNPAEGLKEIEGCKLIDTTVESENAPSEGDIPTEKAKMKQPAE